MPLENCQRLFAPFILFPAMAHVLTPGVKKGRITPPIISAALAPRISEGLLNAATVNRVAGSRKPDYWQ